MTASPRLARRAPSSKRVAGNCSTGPRPLRQLRTQPSEFNVTRRQDEASELTIEQVSTRGNIRGAIDERLVRGLIGVLVRDHRRLRRRPPGAEQIVADVQPGGPISPENGKLPARRGERKMLTLGPPRPGQATLGELSRASELTALRGLVIAAYLRERLLQSVWSGSPSQAEVATGERGAPRG